MLKVGSGNKILNVFLSEQFNFLGKIIKLSCKIYRGRSGLQVLAREDKGDREGITHTHLIP